jgi:hypothetical protein
MEAESAADADCTTVSVVLLLHEERMKQKAIIKPEKHLPIVEV